MMRFFCALTAITLTMAACRPDTKVDVVIPEVTELKLNGVDTSAIEAMAGDTIVLSIRVSDNEAVASLHVVVHAAEDGHAHSGSGHAGGEFHLNSGAWSNDQTLQFTGQNASELSNVQVVIPDTIAGNWHVVVTATDRTGNASKEYTALVSVANSGLPIITGVITPAADAEGTLYLAAGADVLLDGEVQDADGLSEVKAYLMTYAGIQGEITPIAMQGTPVVWDFLGVPFNNALPGTYRLVIEATDILGHRAYWDSRLIVQ